MNFPWLTVTSLLPAVGALVLAFIPKGKDKLGKQVAFVFALATLVLAAIVGIGFKPDGGAGQFQEQATWISQFGVHYSVGVDGIGLVLFLLTALLVPVVMLAGWNEAEGGKRSVKTYFALVLALETLALGVFVATDVFLFYILFEATLIPLYFLIGSYGGPGRAYAAVKFLVYSLVGGLVMLAGVIGLYAVSYSQTDGKPSFLLADLAQLDIDPTTQRWLFIAFFVAFAIKAPMVPVHTWLPDTAREATPGTAVLLVSILDKIGTFGMIRFCLQLFPEASQWATPAVVILAVISVAYGAALAIGQGVLKGDLKRLIAYTSISHFGIMVLGIFAMTSTAQTGSTFYMVSHGLSTAALFLIAGYLISRRGSAKISDFGGVDQVAPKLSGAFLFACLAGLSLPGLSPFVSEFLALAGTFARPELRVQAIIATCAIILAALYMLIVYQRTMTGPTVESVKQVKDLRPREIVAIAPLVVLLLALGLFPKPVLDVISPAVQDTMQTVGVTDPKPVVPVAEESSR